MRKAQKGFTLVELIVVITILAILGTIAFISLQGYSQDARNSKVLSDLRTLTTAIETSVTNGTITLSDLVTGANANNVVAATATVTLFDDQNDSVTGALDNTAVNYEVGGVDFAALRQNGADFKDPEDEAYVAAIAYSGSTAYYQLAGQKKETSGTYTSIVKGNYIPQAGDTPGLISANGSTTGILDGADLGTDDDGTNLYPGN